MKGAGLRSGRALAASGLAALALLSGRPATAESPVEKAISTLVKSVRYSQDARALKQLDGVEQGRALLGPAWESASAAQRSEFVTLFHQLFAALAFPNLRDSLQYLGTTLYEKPDISDDHATIVSTLVIDHPLKKQELRARYYLHKAKDGWKITDVTVLGVGAKSMLTDIRENQIEPILQQGGVPRLLELMRQRLTQVKHK